MLDDLIYILFLSVLMLSSLCVGGAVQWIGEKLWARVVGQPTYCVTVPRQRQSRFRRWCKSTFVVIRVV